MLRLFAMLRRGSWPSLAPMVVLVSACSSDHVTVDDGTKADSALSWAARTFVLDIRGFEWTQPDPRIKDAIGGEFAPPLLVAVDGCTDETCNVTIGAGKDDGSQQMCSPTAQTALVSNSPGESQIGPVDLPLYIQSSDGAVSAIATLHGFTIHETSLYGDGSVTQDWIETTLDFRELYLVYTLADPPLTPDLACEYFADFGGCQPCADMAPYCFTLVIEDLSAVAVPDFVLSDVDPANLPAECDITP